MSIKDYPKDVIAAQPIGSWTGQAYQLVVAAFSKTLAVEGLTRPHWWTLYELSSKPTRHTRTTLTELLKPYDENETNFDEIYDDLIGREWLIEDVDGGLTLTEEGRAAQKRAWERNSKAHNQMLDGIDTDDFVTTINVLRQVVANLGGNGNLPE